MKEGYYWLYLKEQKEWVPGFHDGSDYLPWTVVGSDCIYDDDEFIIGPAIPLPPDVAST